MACFVAPMTEAVVVTVVREIVKRKEKKNVTDGVKLNDSISEAQVKISWSRKLGWLNNLLWGGTLLLAFEHLWHGEVVPWPPFLTAMSSPESISSMLHEIATVGVGMAVFVTAVWAGMVAIADHKTKRTVLTAQQSA